MNRLTLILAAFLVALAAPAASAQDNSAAQADHPKAVVELFTSQGCSSCPPADAYMKTLAQRRDIVALAYHVDYWDYIGWADTFGSAANSDLQRAYAKANGQLRIYTPQMVVNGVKGMVGSNRKLVETAIDKASLPVGVELKIAGGMLEISATAAKGFPESAVWLVPFKSHEDVSIARGENTNRTIDYVNIAMHRQILGMWEPGSGAHIRLPLADIMTKGSDSIAVIVQEDRSGLPGPILGAASLGI